MAEAIIITKGSKRKVHKALLKAGVTEKNIPEQYQDKQIARSKPAAGLGSIVVNNLSGLQPSKAVRAVRAFENNLTGGREDLIEKLEAVEGDLGEKQQQLLALLRNPKNNRKSLAYLIAQVGDNPIQIMKSYAKGCKAVADVEAMVHAARNTPPLVKDIFRHAIDQQSVCMTCVGSGNVPVASNKVNETTVCPACDGSGHSIRSSEHKEWAAKLALELAGHKSKEPLVQVNQQFNTNVQGGLLERMANLSDRILYDRPVEAEILKEEKNEQGA